MQHVKANQEHEDPASDAKCVKRDTKEVEDELPRHSKGTDDYEGDEHRAESDRFDRFPIVVTR
ncbi:hypothetical protein VCR4J2_30119 [Vibrio coralliirubri]|nr:hypothetical protein VCR4J2_30119 [Vibrio coralliirubri]